MNHAALILEDVEDTRAYDSQYKPIPGTGDVRACECCGKNIEVHAYVSAQGVRKVYGTACAKRAGAYSPYFSATNKNFWRRVRLGQ